MITDIEIPAEVPVMTLGNTVLFPQAMMPLFIFEPRYRQMLSDVLQKDRIFAVAALDESDTSANIEEKPHMVASVGIVRACKKNLDGTANLILQGLTRVRFESFREDAPYRTARIEQIISEQDGSDSTYNSIQQSIIALLKTQVRLGAEIPGEVIQFLSDVSEPENALDLAIYTLCPSTALKQRLLEMKGIVPRYEIFADYLRSEIKRLKLDNQLKGELNNDDISNN